MTASSGLVRSAFTDPKSISALSRYATAKLGPQALVQCGHARRFDTAGPVLAAQAAPALSFIPR